MTTALQQATVTERIRSVLHRGVQEAARRRTPVLVSTALRIPSFDSLAVFRRGRTAERTIWQQASAGCSMVAVGAAHRLTGQGDDRFAQIAEGWRDLVSTALVEESDAPPLPGPVSLGGFAFAPARRPNVDWRSYGDALLVVPTYLLVSIGDASWLTVTVNVEPGADDAALATALDAGLRDLLAEGDTIEVTQDAPAEVVPDADGQADRWKEAVRTVIDQIHQGTIQKLVLAREVRVRASAPLDPGTVLARLRRGYGDCTLFAFAQGERCFLGATPERLVRVEGTRIQATCLAGSAPRGASEGEDQRLGEALLASGKERHEHALVLDALRDALAPVCRELTIPEAPVLLQTRNIQHLHTPLEGVLADSATVLELVELLHPTPASAGLPRAGALALLRTQEAFDRGWYAGPVGWMDRTGSGEFVVAIRSALVAEQEASLYAGCGIVAGSDPDQEYAESSLKLMPMLWALNTTTT